MPIHQRVVTMAPSHPVPRSSRARKLGSCRRTGARDGVSGVVLSVVLGAVLLGPGAASAQSAGSRIDQPTAGTLPPGTSTVQGRSAADEPSGQVAPPSAIQSSTDVMQSGGSVQGKGKSSTDPVKHLPENMR